MTRLTRIPRTLLLLTALSLLGACDHQRGGPLGPLDGDKLGDGQHGADKLGEQPYVAPVDLELDATLANNLVIADAGSELVARIRIEAPAELDLPRPPARVVLVVDTSASMKGDAIEGAKQAAMVLVDSLADNDSFSLVVFHSRAETLMSATLIGDESRAAAKAEIERMQAWGTTDLGGGLRLALEQLATAPVSMANPEGGALVSAGPGVWTGAGPDPSVLERVVLLGDGVPNDPSQIAALTQQFAARGAEITALGYGLEYDEVMLASLAEQTHGHFQFIEQPEAVAAVFRDEVLHIQRTVARDLRLALGLGPGIGLIEVVGHTPQWNPSTARNEIALGSISEGQTHELIVRLAVGPHRDGVTVELSDLELAFTDVYTGTGNRFERNFLSAIASADATAVLGGRNLEIARAGARARTSAATLQVLSLARSGALDQSKQLLSESVKWAKDAAKSLEDDDLRKQAEQLAALEPELRALARQAQQPVAAVGGQPGPQPFPAEPSAQPSIDGARKVKEAHSAAYNEIHQ
jgi:Ca-activated chloride channel family protein